MITTTLLRMEIIFFGISCTPISTNLVYIVVHQNYPKLKIIKKKKLCFRRGENHQFVRVRIFLVKLIVQIKKKIIIIIGSKKIKSNYSIKYK
jgi:hypothetical protein